MKLLVSKNCKIVKFIYIYNKSLYILQSFRCFKVALRRLEISLVVLALSSALFILFDLIFKMGSFKSHRVNIDTQLDTDYVTEMG